MSGSRALYTKQWTDDHLDLLNYAREIGDTQWLADLLLILNESELQIARELKQKKKDELWRRYDLINGLLLELYSELRSSERKEQQELMDRLLALKQQRLEISRQLATIG
jgi:hypothetical protein